MQDALAAIWPLLGELFRPDEDGFAAVAPGEVDAVLDAVLAAARLDRPGAVPLARVSGHAGRDGVHTEAMGYILAELQSLARAHPDATW
jgi:ring-1,2-phenylacetyl-CoA epoxidase subunit PaaC